MKRFCCFCSTFLILALIVTHAQAKSVLLKPAKTLAIKTQADRPVTEFGVEFDLTRIPKGLFIELAELRLKTDFDSLSTRIVNVTVKAATETWIQSSVPRIGRVAVTDTLRADNFGRTGAGQNLEINVTEIVRAWHRGKAQNRGMILSISSHADQEFKVRQNVGEWQVVLFIRYSKVEFNPKGK